ncbi:F0F1 ATP synthase subunit B' [Pseudanabaena sp. FACHB-1277]|jgi:F-type H+-transporting ATPase subunit b|uniref:ATP synthase subunit b' n=1 Tax=Pseudanabaena cinerea FACHB-1277 TaxID=2949581 RepID=A0A926UTC9_9CYAN|nr:F0F1 ATP synthase subunit B' [Pseudanabaena cinerea]MBD2149710.1 F0F1 ATP synthase subunit B' [Pseudanabaena cinerea FACHB-1277]
MTIWNLFSTVLVAAEAVEHKGGLFDINATLPIMAVQFVVFVALLNVVFFKPLTKAIDDRDDYVREQIIAAKERLEKAELVVKQYEQELASARKATQNVLTTAQSEANKIRKERIDAAMAEAQSKVASAKAEIEKQKQNATASLDAEVESLSRQVLEKLLGNLVKS